MLSDQYNSTKSDYCVFLMSCQLPIIDAHHHLWDKLQLWPGADENILRRYLIDELAADTDCGHNVIKTVFVQCNSMHKKDGDELFKPLGEVQFAQGVAAMSASGIYGDCEHCAGIVSTVDLAAGAAVEPVLLEMMKQSPNFRGIRFKGGAAESISFEDATFREGIAILDKLSLTFDCNGPETHPLDFETVLSGLTSLASAFPSLSIIVDHLGGAGEDTLFSSLPPSFSPPALCVLHDSVARSLSPTAERHEFGSSLTVPAILQWAQPPLRASRSASNAGKNLSLLWRLPRQT